MIKRRAIDFEKERKKMNPVAFFYSKLSAEQVGHTILNINLWPRKGLINV